MSKRQNAYKSPFWAKRRRTKELEIDQKPEEFTPVYPPKKQTIDLRNFTILQNNHHTNSVIAGDWFEDAYHFYYMDYSEGESRLVLAQEKNLYTMNTRYHSTKFFNLVDYKFDGRFIYGKETASTLRFGQFKDNNFGQILYLTEPKDATDVLISMSELAGSLSWIDNMEMVRYAYHDTNNFVFYVVVPVGTRFLEDKQVVVTHSANALKDRELYQRLFEEELKIFAGFDIERTRFEGTLPGPTEEEIEEKARREEEAVQRRNSIIDGINKTKELINFAIASRLEEFDLNLTLDFDIIPRMIGPREIVRFKLIHNGEGSAATTIYSEPIECDSFINLEPERNAQTIAHDAIIFLDRHREKYQAYKRVYGINEAYHNLLNADGVKPYLSYERIFRENKLTAE